MLPRYNTGLFSEIFINADAFWEDYQVCSFPKDVSEENIRLIYALLLAAYGQSSIANETVDQFKIKLWSIVWQYAPTWVTRIDIQKRLRELPLEELKKGGKAIYNRALHPGTEPTDASLEELDFIDSQNVTNFKKSTPEAMAIQWDLLRDNLTKQFISRFKILFRTILRPEVDSIYTEECTDE